MCREYVEVLVEDCVMLPQYSSIVAVKCDMNDWKPYHADYYVNAIFLRIVCN